MDQAKTDMTGGCRCGAVALTLDAPPILTMACHCNGCQRMTASAFSLSALVPETALKFDGPEPVIGGLKDPKQLHHFCPLCLSWLFTRIEGLEGFVNLRTSLIDGLADAPPFIEVWTDEKLPWVGIEARHSYAALPDPADFRDLLADYAQSQAA